MLQKWDKARSTGTTWAQGVLPSFCEWVVPISSARSLNLWSDHECGENAAGASRQQETFILHRASALSMTMFINAYIYDGASKSRWLLKQTYLSIKSSSQIITRENCENFSPFSTTSEQRSAPMQQQQAKIAGWSKQINTKCEHALSRWTQEVILLQSTALKIIISGTDASHN